MRRNSLLTLVLAGASFCFVYTLPAMAQSQGSPPSGGAPMGGQPQTGSPGGAMGPGQSGPMQGPSDTMQMPKAADDKKFAKEAAYGNMTEVEVGKLAQEKSSSPAVKQFGQKLEQDHTKANAQLKQAATQDGLTIPDSLDSKHQKTVDKLSKLSGEEFDKAFIKDAVKDHQRDIKDFQNEAENGKHPNVKKFASEAVPVLQSHLSMAKSLKESKGASLTASAKEQ